MHRGKSTECYNISSDFQVFDDDTADGFTQSFNFCFLRFLYQLLQI